MSPALAQLTDKIDPMYIIPKDRPEPHDDAHIFLIFFLAAILDFLIRKSYKGGIKMKNVYFCTLTNNMGSKILNS